MFRFVTKFVYSLFLFFLARNERQTGIGGVILLPGLNRGLGLSPELSGMPDPNYDDGDDTFMINFSNFFDHIMQSE